MRSWTSEAPGETILFFTGLPKEVTKQDYQVWLLEQAYWSGDPIRFAFYTHFLSFQYHSVLENKEWLLILLEDDLENLGRLGHLMRMLKSSDSQVRRYLDLTSRILFDGFREYPHGAASPQRLLRGFQDFCLYWPEVKDLIMINSGKDRL